MHTRKNIRPLLTIKDRQNRVSARCTRLLRSRGSPCFLLPRPRPESVGLLVNLAALQGMASCWFHGTVLTMCRLSPFRGISVAGALICVFGQMAIKEQLSTHTVKLNYHCRFTVSEDSADVRLRVPHRVHIAVVEDSRGSRMMRSRGKMSTSSCIHQPSKDRHKFIN